MEFQKCVINSKNRIFSSPQENNLKKFIDGSNGWIRLCDILYRQFPTFIERNCRSHCVEQNIAERYLKLINRKLNI